MDDLPVVILCGGRGTRLREQTEFMPKPLVKIGNKPILWHIMKHYSHYGFNNFILCLGYRGDSIKEYFLNYDSMLNDFTLNLKGKKEKLYNHTNTTEDWNITFADTGFNTLTGGRIKRIEKYIKADNFLATYGDGVSNVDIKKLIEFHKTKGKVATLTGAHPWSKYGTVHADENGIVTEFKEKPILKDIINGGYFVFKKEIFDYIKDDIMLENEPFDKLAEKREMALFKHDGFWHCMDTYKDFQDLNDIWKAEAPWKIW